MFKKYFFFVYQNRHSNEHLKLSTKNSKQGLSNLTTTNPSKDTACVKYPIKKYEEERKINVVDKRVLKNGSGSCLGSNR